MNITNTRNLSIATCIAFFALILLCGYLLKQKDKGNRDYSEPYSALTVGTETSTQVIDSPIQPIAEIKHLNPEIIVLGEMLFHEPRLSSTNTVSCANCHNLSSGGDDSMIRSIGINGNEGNINSPTVFNASLNITQFWDGRSPTLTEQIDGPIHNPNELGSGWSQIINKLKSDESYKSTFDKLYPDGITSNNIKNAIATFEQSLLTVNSPFDRYLQGDLSAINNSAKQGYEKFKEYGCIACHQGRNVGGNLYQRLGVMGDYFSDRGTEITQSDLGRFNVTGLEEDKYVFRVPSLRLAPLTAPYFHDGSAATLKDAVRVMIKYQLGRTASEEDEDLIIEFLNTLVGEYNGKSL